MRVRPVTMTALTAILGLLPAAFSTAIGAQTQRQNRVRHRAGLSREKYARLRVLTGL
jgi:multidrug efflux pump subunit AcrB